MAHTTNSGGDAIWRPTRLAIYARDGFRCIVCAMAPDGAQFMATAHAMLCWATGPHQWEAVRRFIAARAAQRGECLTKGLTLDHVRPGRDNSPTNLVTMCVSCNSRKGDRPLGEVYPDVVERVAWQVQQPLARAVGRQLCPLVYPTWRRVRDAA